MYQALSTDLESLKSPMSRELKFEQSVFKVPESLRSRTSEQTATMGRVADRNSPYLRRAGVI
jgi:hypothetical protein